MERTIGPINGFRLRYWFVKEEVVSAQRGGRRDGRQHSRSFRTVTLCRSRRRPASRPAKRCGPTPNCTSSCSGLQAGRHDCHHLDLPGNFDRLRELKRAIRELGFQIAVRPLPKGMPIGASRHGRSRSANSRRLSRLQIGFDGLRSSASGSARRYAGMIAARARIDCRHRRPAANRRC